MARKTIYDVGAEIFAKWPGSQMYYPGTVVEGYDESNDSYKVKFDNEGEPVAVLARNITVWHLTVVAVNLIFAVFDESK